jgi:hypothetical protein
MTARAVRRRMKTAFRIDGFWAQFLNYDNPYHEARTKVTYLITVILSMYFPVALLQHYYVGLVIR